MAGSGQLPGWFGMHPRLTVGGHQTQSCATGHTGPISRADEKQQRLSRMLLK